MKPTALSLWEITCRDMTVGWEDPLIPCQSLISPIHHVMLAELLLSTACSRSAAAVLLVVGCWQLFSQNFNIILQVLYNIGILKLVYKHFKILYINALTPSRPQMIIVT